MKSEQLHLLRTYSMDVWALTFLVTRAFGKWITLTQSLSGLFCASLNFIDSTRTTRPVASFELTGDHPDYNRLHLLHGSLPGEVVCTENLTPFLKLLPCKGKAGISSLFDGHKLFDASWQSMSIDMRPLRPSRGEPLVQIEQTVDMILDIERSKRPRGLFIATLAYSNDKHFRLIFLRQSHSSTGAE